MLSSYSLTTTSPPWCINRNENASWSHVSQGLRSILNLQFTDWQQEGIGTLRHKQEKKSASPRDGYVIPSLSFSLSAQPQEAEFCIFRGRNNSLISLVFMLVSHFLPNHSCSPPTHCHNTYAVVIEISVLKNACRTVNTGFKINLATSTWQMHVERRWRWGTARRLVLRNTLGWRTPCIYFQATLTGFMCTQDYTAFEKSRIFNSMSEDRC